MSGDKEDNVKIGLGIWVSLCLLLCLWLIRGFTKGRQQFQNNLHVIEDGLRRMQENIELEQRKKSMGYVENLEDITGFLDNLSGKSDNKTSNEPVDEDDSKQQNSEALSEPDDDQEQEVSLPNTTGEHSGEFPEEEKKTV